MTRNLNICGNAHEIRLKDQERRREKKMSGNMKHLATFELQQGSDHTRIVQFQE